jgi:20S proteasome alpha/beta subunit
MPNSSSLVSNPETTVLDSLCSERVREESLVTFQVALVGQDCVVMGSDRLLSEYLPLENGGGVTQRASGGKIFIADGVACMHAGGSQSREMARAVINKRHPQELTLSQWENYLKEIVESIKGALNVVEELIVVRTCDLALTKTRKIGNAIVEASSVENKICAGDVHLPARFLSEHLWKEGMPEDKLINLALLTLAFAHEENPSGVGCGYDILTVRRNPPIEEPKTFSEDQGRKLYEEFHSKLRAAFDSTHFSEL